MPATSVSLRGLLRFRRGLLALVENEAGAGEEVACALEPSGTARGTGHPRDHQRAARAIPSASAAGRIGDPRCVFPADPADPATRAPRCPPSDGPHWPRTPPDQPLPAGHRLPVLPTKAPGGPYRTYRETPPPPNGLAAVGFGEHVSISSRSWQTRTPGSAEPEAASTAEVRRAGRGGAGFERRPIAP